MWNWHIEVLSFEFMITLLVENVFSIPVYIVHKSAQWWQVSCRELAISLISSVGTSE
jgi:hypothetical protein